jgi:hypothetical protein
VRTPTQNELAARIARIPLRDLEAVTSELDSTGRGYSLATLSRVVNGARLLRPAERRFLALCLKVYAKRKEEPSDDTTTVEAAS